MRCYQGGPEAGKFTSQAFAEYVGGVNFEVSRF
jgi:hypothetical protein